MKKQLFALVTAIALSSSLMAMPAFAEEPTSEADVNITCETREEYDTPVTIEVGKLVKLPDGKNLVKEGCIFVGWNTDPNATEGFFEYRMTEEDVKFYAIWIETPSEESEAAPAPSEEPAAAATPTEEATPASTEEPAPSETPVSSEEPAVETEESPASTETTAPSEEPTASNAVSEETHADSTEAQSETSEPAPSLPSEEGSTVGIVQSALNMLAGIFSGSSQTVE